MRGQSLGSSALGVTPHPHTQPMLGWDARPTRIELRAAAAQLAGAPRGRPTAWEVTGVTTVAVPSPSYRGPYVLTTPPRRWGARCSTWRDYSSSAPCSRLSPRVPASRPSRAGLLGGGRLTRRKSGCYTTFAPPPARKPRHALCLLPSMTGPAFSHSGTPRTPPPSPVFYHYLSCGVRPAVRNARFTAARCRPLPDTVQMVAHLSAAAAGVAAAAAAEQTRGEVDLHGLTVPEAVAVVVGLWESGIGRQSVPQGGQLLLITGVGAHSGWGGARLRPAVLTLLDEMGVAYEDQRGAVLVACRGPRRGPLRGTSPAWVWGAAAAGAAAAVEASASASARAGGRVPAEGTAPASRRQARPASRGVHGGGDSHRLRSSCRSQHNGDGGSRVSGSDSGGSGYRGVLGWLLPAGAMTLVAGFLGLLLAWVATRGRGGW